MLGRKAYDLIARADIIHANSWRTGVAKNVIYGLLLREKGKIYYCTLCPATRDARCELVPRD